LHEFLPLIFASTISDLLLVLLKKESKKEERKVEAKKICCAEKVGKERREIRVLVCTSAEFSYQVV